MPTQQNNVLSAEGAHYEMVAPRLKGFLSDAYAAVEIGVALLLAGELGGGACDELVGDAAGLVLGEAEEGAEGAHGERSVLAAVVCQADDDVSHRDLFGVSLLLADEVDDGLADGVVELPVGLESDALYLQVVGGDGAGLGDALLLEADLQVERAEALDVEVAPVQQLLGDLLLQRLHQQFVESGADDGVLLDMVAQEAARHGHADAAHVVRGLLFCAAWCLVDIVGDAVSFFDFWHNNLKFGAKLRNILQR